MLYDVGRTDWQGPDSRNRQTPEGKKKKEVSSQKKKSWRSLERVGLFRVNLFVKLQGQTCAKKRCKFRGGAARRECARVKKRHNLQTTQRETLDDVNEGKKGKEGAKQRIAEDQRPRERDLNFQKRVNLTKEIKS